MEGLKNLLLQHKKKLLTLVVVALLGVIGVKLAPEQSEAIACGILGVVGSPCETAAPAP